MSLDGVLFWSGRFPVLLFILVGLVLVHELGHFIMARLDGGPGPGVRDRLPRPRRRSWGTITRPNTRSTWLPIGGFVRLEGEETDSEDRGLSATRRCRGSY